MRSWIRLDWHDRQQQRLPSVNAAARWRAEVPVRGAVPSIDSGRTKGRGGLRGWSIAWRSS